MSLITLCILLLCIQPLVIYKVMFSKKEKKKSDIEYELSFLIIAPCFIFFYLEIFWYALLSLGGVSILGGLLVKLFEKKAKYSLPLKELYYFLIVWFGLFSIGYGVVNLWDFLTNLFNTSTVQYSTEQVEGIPKDNSELLILPKEPLYSYYLHTLGFLSSMVLLFFMRAYEIISSTKKVVAANFYLILCLAAALLPLLSEYYFSSLIFNFLILAFIGGNIVTYKVKYPVASNEVFGYSFHFIMALGVSIICKAFIWVFSF